MQRLYVEKINPQVEEPPQQLPKALLSPSSHVTSHGPSQTFKSRHLLDLSQPIDQADLLAPSASDQNQTSDGDSSDDSAVAPQSGSTTQQQEGRKNKMSMRLVGPLVASVMLLLGAGVAFFVVRWRLHRRMSDEASPAESNNGVRYTILQSS